MRNTWTGLVTALALGAAGCGEPMIAPVVMPGSKPKVEISEVDRAESVGEEGIRGNVQLPTVNASTILPAEPTKPGESRRTTGDVEYTTLRQGTGATVAQGQRVEVHYIGALTDGTKVDSSRDRNQPLVFRIGGPQRSDEMPVIQGWNVGVAGMKVGEVRRLTIPPELAYGATGSPPVIPPSATLVFEIELLKAE